MKVKITADSRKVITMAQTDIAKRIIESCAEDEATAAEYARYAVNAIMRKHNDCCDTVLQCSAEIAGNGRVWNRILEDSENLDVWISGIAKCGCHFCEFGAYLSDIWEICGEDGEDNHMFSVVYGRL